MHAIAHSINADLDDGMWPFCHKEPGKSIELKDIKDAKVTAIADGLLVEANTSSFHGGERGGFCTQYNHYLRLTMTPDELLQILAKAARKGAVSLHGLESLSAAKRLLDEAKERCDEAASALDCYLPGNLPAK